MNRPRLERPTRIPYEDVAAIVCTWPRVRGYVAHIAELYGIPVATARGWVAKTRRRGLLPPGTAARPCPACAGTGVARWGPQAPHGIPA